MDSQEQIIDAIYKVMRTVKREQPLIGVAGVAVGVSIDTINAIFITESRLLFVTVPIAGTGKYVAGIDVTMFQSMYGSKWIAKRGEEMRQTMTPQAILESNKNNFELPFDMIRSYKIRTFFIGRGFKIIDTRGQKYSYAIPNKGDLARFSAIMADKAVAK